MASNKGKTHMAALPVNVPQETNGGRLAYPSAAQDTENLRAMLEGRPPFSIRKDSMPRWSVNQVTGVSTPSAKDIVNALQKRNTIHR